MRISAIQSYCFTSNSIANDKKTNTQPELLEGQFKKHNKVFNRHSTSYFRQDMDWNALAKVFQKRFAGEKKVNTFVWACSDGDEAYTLAILLKHYFGDDYKKFLPVKAMDIDKNIILENISKQKNGFEFRAGELTNLCYGLDIVCPTEMNKVYDYVVPDGIWKRKLSDSILNSVEFEFSNILTDLDKIDPNVPTIVMCRNMWPYVEANKYDEFAKKLHDRLNPNSLVIVGRYDWEGEGQRFASYTFPKALKKCGFKTVGEIVNPDPYYDALPRDCSLVFEKK